jgi:hypothetical protein
MRSIPSMKASSAAKNATASTMARRSMPTASNHPRQGLVQERSRGIKIV